MRLSALMMTALMLATSPVLAFDLQAHRGGRALWPENTLPAFERALDLGVDTLELDVGVTRDGQLIIAHDRHVDTNLARRDGKWVEGVQPTWHSLTLAETQAFDVGRIRPGSAYAKRFANQMPIDGTTVPTLASLFDLVKKRKGSNIHFNIETKIDPTAPGDSVGPETFATLLVKQVRAAGLEKRVTIQSFDFRTLQVVQKIAPEISTAYLTIIDPEESTVSITGSSPWSAGFDPVKHDGSLPAAIKAAGGAIWSPYHPNLTRELLKEAHGLGLKVLPWTVNDAADMKRLIDWGVDGLITDDPATGRKVLGR
ncbi:glycerophosphodiester phosphodiesterase [Niveispirillum sp. KHB5.9]|uniref:glycerophosphodiester phosphodiesterase n=1 Tax=Niveispirillum sp. KHB5.9 TaxID=3400269 RepID=UPI003A88DFF2